MFRSPTGDGKPWKRVLRRACTETETRDIFDRAEAALNTTTEAPARADVRAARTIRMLGEEYLKDSRARDRHPRTIQGRESRLNAHIVFSTRGREDLRGQLAAMRKLAWRLGWLDRSVDPLDGLEIGRATVFHGATTHYVDPRLRPETRQVRAMADAADKLCGPDDTDPLMTRLPSSARRSASPASAGCASASRTRCERSMCSSTAATSTSTAPGVHHATRPGIAVRSRTTSSTWCRSPPRS